MTKARRRQPEPIGGEFLGPLLKALEEPWRTGFALAFHTGIRLSEVERLEWGHVDAKKRVLHFPGAKGGDWRPVPMLGGTDTLLLAMKRGRDRELVLPGFADRTARARAWREAAVAVGMGRWHCRRCGEAP